MPDLALFIAAPFVFLGGVLLLFFVYGWVKNFTKWWRGRHVRRIAQLRAEVVRARTLAAPTYTATARVRTPEEIADLELEGTRPISVDILGAWLPPDDLESAPLYEKLLHRRPFALGTAVGPGWIGEASPRPDKPQEQPVVAAK